MKKRYIAFVWLGLTLILVWYFSASLLSAYAGLFQINNARKGADAIIVLGGNQETRPEYAAMLAKSGYADHVFVTNPRPMSTKHPEIYLNETLLYQKVLAVYDINATIIPSLKGGATSTFDEAYDVAAYLENHPMKRIIIVTDAFHTSRSHYAFAKVFSLLGKEDIIIEMAAAPNEVYTNENWWKTEKGIKAYLLEPLKFLFYRFNSANSTQINDQG